MVIEPLLGDFDPDLDLFRDYMLATFELRTPLKIHCGKFEGYYYKHTISTW